jgi:hypothetical protein
VIAWDKLKHEWKTFAFGVLTTAVGAWDCLAPSGYDLSVFIPEKYRPYAVPAIGVTFLLLRQYRHQKDRDVEHNQ